MDDNNLIERYVEKKNDEIEIPSLTKLRESIFNLKFEAEEEKELLKDLEAEVEEYEKQTEIFERDIKIAMGQTKKNENDATFYAERSVIGLETIERLKNVQLYLHERREKFKSENFELDIEYEKKIKEMKRTIEEYKSRYDEYLSKIEKIDGFSRIREIQKQVEQAMKQEEIKRSKSAAEKDKMKMITHEVKETWGKIKENIISAAQAYHNCKENHKKLIQKKKDLEMNLKNAVVEIRPNHYFNDYFMNANEIAKTKNGEAKPQAELDFRKNDYDDEMFKKPVESNSSIKIKRVEKNNFDFKEMVKLDNFDFMSKLSQEINKKKNAKPAKDIKPVEDVKPVEDFKSVVTSTVNLDKVLNIEMNHNKALSDVSRVSSVESFRQFNKKLSQKTNQTSSPLPNIPNFFNELKFIKNTEATKKTVNKEVNATESLKKTMGKTDAIFKDIGVIKRTTTTTTTNYTNDLKKYATSFDLFEGVSNITESLNILHKKIGAPTLNIEQSTKQGNLIDRKITNDRPKFDFDNTIARINDNNMPPAIKSFAVPQLFESNSNTKDINSNFDKNIISNSFDFNIIGGANTNNTNSDNNMEIKNDFFTLFETPSSATVSSSNKISSSHNFNFALDDLSSQNNAANENNQFKSFNFF